MNHPRFHGHLGLQQRVLPNYRVPFFELLAQSCESMSLFAGMPQPEEGLRLLTYCILCIAYLRKIFIFSAERFIFVTNTA
jgi:hypothetical protein